MYTILLVDVPAFIPILFFFPFILWRIEDGKVKFICFFAIDCLLFLALYWLFSKLPTDSPQRYERAVLFANIYVSTHVLGMLFFIIKRIFWDKSEKQISYVAFFTPFLVAYGYVIGQERIVNWVIDPGGKNFDYLSFLGVFVFFSVFLFPLSFFLYAFQLLLSKKILTLLKKETVYLEKERLISGLSFVTSSIFFLNALFFLMSENRHEKIYDGFWAVSSIISPMVYALFIIWGDKMFMTLWSESLFLKNRKSINIMRIVAFVVFGLPYLFSVVTLLEYI